MTIIKYLIPSLLASASLFSLNSTWTLNANGNWATGTPANWSAGVPNAVDDVAQFLSAITADRTISLSQATTIGTANFNNNNAYKIESNVLTFQKTMGNAQVNVPVAAGTGAHEIGSHVVLGSSLVIDHNVNSNFFFAGPISGSETLTVQGNNGQTHFTGTIANSYSGLTTVDKTLASAGLTLGKTGVVAIPGDLLISFGTVTTGAASQFSSTSELTLNGTNAAFAIGPFSQTVGHFNYKEGAFTAAGGTLTLASHATALTLGNNVTVNPSLALSGLGGIEMSFFPGSNVVLAGALDLGGFSHIINVPSGVGGLTATGIISGVGGGVVKKGFGPMTLAGAASNTYSGATMVDEGTLSLNKSGATAIPGTVFINGGTLTLLAADQISNNSTMILQSGIFNLSNFNETIDRLDFIAGTVDGLTQTLTLQSPTVALQMSGNTFLTGGGTIAISNASGGVNFDASSNGMATIENMSLALGSHIFSIASGGSIPDMQIMGQLSGGGSLVKEGVGTLELSGGTSNTFTGTTTVNAGRLSLNKTGGALAIPVAAGDVVVNGGVLFLKEAEQMASSKAVTVNGGFFDLNGNHQTLGTLNYLGGSLNQSGGILTLTDAVNPLTMGATIINGQVIVQPGGPITFNGAPGAATMNGDLILASQNSFNINNGSEIYDMTINSQITGPGGISKTGLGTLFLLGSNSYTGQTTVIQGILQGSSMSLPPVVTTITNPGTLVFDQTVDGTFLGALGGTGDMIKQGEAVLQFSTPQTVGGATTVTGGTLLINNTFGGAGPLSVSSGATLAGMGTVNKDVTVDGVLSPGGHGIGVLTLNGTQTLSAGSILDIELTPTMNDSVMITGTVNIGPDATFNFFPAPAIHIEPLSYTVVQTTGGRTGTFDYINDPFPLFFGKVSYDANNVYFSISLFPVAELPGLSRNAQKVANCLDRVNSRPGSDLYNVLNSLRFISTVESIEKSLLDMQPSLFASLGAIKQDGTLYVRSALFSRLESRSRSCMRESRGIRYWGTPLIGVSQENNHGKEAGYNALTPGIAVGVDGWLFERFQVGGSLSYTNSAVQWKKKRGSGRIHGIYGAVYSRLGFKIGFLESAIILGYDRYSTQRNIHIGGLLPINRAAKASRGGCEASGHIKGAFRLPVEKALLGPYASLDYQWQYEGGFNEHGANGLNLRVLGKHANFMQSEIGIDAAYCFPLDRKTLNPYLQISGVWEKRFNGAKEASFFGGCPTDVYGYYRSRFLIGASGGFDVRWVLETAPRASFNYKGKYGLGYQDHTFNLTLIY